HVPQCLCSDDDVVRQRTTYAMRNTYDEGLVRTLAGLVTNNGAPATARAAAVAALAALHRQARPWDGHWWGTQPVLSPPPKKEVEWAGTPIVVKALSDALGDRSAEVRLAAVKGLQVAPDPDSGDTLA